MKIPFSLLSDKPREQVLIVPAHPKDPSFGVGRVKVRELSSLAFDNLWSELVIAERLCIEASRKVTQNRLDLEAQVELNQAKQDFRGAQDCIIDACVVGHHSASFCAEVPKVGPEDPDYQGVITVLCGAGYSEEEAQEACKYGIAEKKFSGGKDAARFYRLCQPDEIFLSTLLLFIYRFQRGELLSASEIWKSNGVKQEDIPANF